jgi:hypothetical protein
MQELSTHKTLALPANAKEVLEKLLGRRLADDEEVSIWASRPHAAPTGKAREQAWRMLSQHLDGMAAKTNGSAEEIEKLIDEACDEVRHEPR